MAKTRDTYFDLLKCVAMFMVVVSHVQSYRPGFSFSAMPAASLNFIMVVNMPLFFIISGFFSRGLHESGSWLRLTNRLIMYFWPLIIFSFFTVFLDGIVSHKCLISTCLSVFFKRLVFGGWFFYTIAYCEIITFSVKKHCSGERKVVFWGLAFLMCLGLSGIVPHLSSVVAMIPFYWYGLVILPKMIERPVSCLVCAALGFVVMFYVTYCTSGIAFNGLSFYWDKFDVWHPKGIMAVHMLVRYAVGILGSIFIMVFIRMLYNKIPYVSALSRFGRETLGIYFVHGYLIHYGSNRFVELDANIMWILFASVLVFVLAYLMVKILKFNSVVSRIVWGIKLHEWHTK